MACIIGLTMETMNQPIGDAPDIENLRKISSDVGLSLENSSRPYSTIKVRQL